MVVVTATVIGIVLVIVGLSVVVAIFTRRAGYTRGPYWRSPVTTFRQSGPARRVGVLIGILGLIAYLAAVWRGPDYLPNIVLGGDFVLLGFVNILEPMVPNTRLNLRWMGVAFVLLGLGDLVLGMARALSHHRLSPLVLGVEIALGAGIIISFVLAYIRAFPSFDRR